MPGRFCAVPVLEFKSLKVGREKLPTELDETRWVELHVLHPCSRPLTVSHVVTTPTWKSARLRSFFNTGRENTRSNTAEEERALREETVSEEAERQSTGHLTGRIHRLFITQTPLPPTKLTYSKNHKHDFLFCSSWLLHLSSLVTKAILISLDEVKRSFFLCKLFSAHGHWVILPWTAVPAVFGTVSGWKLGLGYLTYSASVCIWALHLKLM